MTGHPWIRRLFTRTPHPARKAPARSRLLVEALEGRLAPATLTVTSTADALHYNSSATVTDLTNHTNLVNGNSDATVTLRDALNAANNTGGGYTIVLSNATYDFTAVDNYWYGPNALPAISSAIIINGNGATLQRDSSLPNTTAGALRFFYVSGGLSGLAAGSLTLNNLTLKGGYAKGGDSAVGGGGLGAGEAIFNQGTLSLYGVALTGNTAQRGNSNVGTSNGFGGGGIGQDAQGYSGGGFGGPLVGGPFGGVGHRPAGTGYPGGGGGGFSASATDFFDGAGQSGFGGRGNGIDGVGGFGGDGGGGGGAVVDGVSGAGGSFGDGGGAGGEGEGGGGGGGVGGDGGGGGGFGGGGGAALTGGDGNGGFGGFGGGGAAGFGGGGFGGGNGGRSDNGGGGAGLGGAVFSMYGSVTVVNSIFTSNTAVGGNTGDIGVDAGQDGSGFGGALFNLDGTVTLTGATLSGNTVTPGNGQTGNGSSGGSDVYNLAYGSSPTGTAQTASVIAVNSTLTDLVNNQDTHKNANDKAVTLTITVTPYTSATTTYDGAAHMAKGTATGLGSIDLSSDLSFEGTKHTNAGTYASDTWSFHDSMGTYPDASGTLSDSIAPAALTVTADNQSMAYGGTVPSLSYTYAGLVNNDTSGSFTGALATAATSGSNVAGYDITQGTLAATGNYTIGSFTKGTLTVNPAPLTVMANDVRMIQGEAFPSFTVSYKGFVLNQDPSVLGGTLKFSTTAPNNTTPGTYAITPSGLTSGNYAITFLPDKLTVLSYGQATADLQTGPGGVDAAGLASGLQSSLDTQLQAAIADFAAGDTADGVSQLGAFINHVSAQRGKGIAAGLADAWIAAAQRIINAVG
jgi:hypothetical protein